MIENFDNVQRKLFDAATAIDIRHIALDAAVATVSATGLSYSEDRVSATLDAARAYEEFLRGETKSAEQG